MFDVEMRKNSFEFFTRGNKYYLQTYKAHKVFHEKCGASETELL